MEKSKEQSHYESFVDDLQTALIQSIAVEAARRLGSQSKHVSAVMSQYMTKLRERKAPCVFDFVDDYIKNNDNDVRCCYAGKSGGATGICVDPDL